jgi:hypothetical protein
LLAVVLFRSGYAGGVAWKGGLALLLVWGVSVVLDGIFPIDKGVNPVTTAGQIHMMAALLLSLSFRKLSIMRGTASIVLVLVGLILASFALSIVLDTLAQGFIQRLFVLACLVWLFVVVIRVRTSLK